MKERIIYILEPVHTPDWAPKDDPSKYYLDRIQKIGIGLHSMTLAGRGGKSNMMHHESG